jgi:transposase, IS5 family
MRRIIRRQPSIVETTGNHQHTAELRKIDEILRALPRIAELVHGDLVRGLMNPHTGRRGNLTADQVVRILLVKQMNGFSYEQLAFHLADSKTYRAFCGIGFVDKIPKSSILQRDIKKLRPETLEQINVLILGKAKHEGIEKGRKARIDCTVVETNIHHPTDSSLLNDCVQVLARSMDAAKENFEVNFTFADHRRRAKKRALGILNAKSQKKRLRPYKDLLLVASVTVAYAEQAAKALALVVRMKSGEPDIFGAARGTAKELSHYVGLAKKVIDQTERRVVKGEQVPAQEKVVSIFEPHTDIIIKDQRETRYGHKVVLTGGASGLFTDLVVLDGNPADSTLALDIVQRQERIFDRVPLKAAFDGGFASKANLQQIKDLGVRDVTFRKKRGLNIAEMAKSTWVYKRLCDFRAGIEGMISFLKRCFGLRRCNWQGYESFKSYAWASVISANLLLMARHLLV